LKECLFLFGVAAVEGATIADADRDSWKLGSLADAGTLLPATTYPFETAAEPLLDTE